MNICFPINYPGVGGSEKYALYLAKEAKKAGHKVFFVLGGQGPLAPELKEFAVTYIPMKSSFNPFSVISAIFKLKNFFKEKDINIVHAGQLREQSLAIGAKIFGAQVKVIRTFHRLGQFNLKMKIILGIYKKFTDQFIAVSEPMAKSMAQNGITKNVTVIKNGVPEVVVKKHEPAIGFLGRLAPEKGILNFIRENTDPLKTHQLVVAGDGPELPEIKDVTTENQLKIEFLGSVSDLSGFFSSIKVLVLPTKGESTLPLSVIESFSAGVPVVAFDVPGISGTYQNPKCLTLVSEGNFKDLAEKALSLATDKEWAAASKEAKRAYEENFTVREMWQETEKVYQKVL